MLLGRFHLHHALLSRCKVAREGAVLPPRHADTLLSSLTLVVLAAFKCDADPTVDETVYYTKFANDFGPLNLAHLWECFIQIKSQMTKVRFRPLTEVYADKSAE